MPELPEVETVRRGLAPHMEGKVITRVELRRPDLRFPFPEGFVANLDGQRIEALSRRAKYLTAHLSNHFVLIMHLGMSGSFRVEEENPGNEAAGADAVFYHERGKLAAHDHVVFHIQGGARVIYNDPRRFGFMDLVPADELTECKHFRNMGVEPTGNALSPDYMAERFNRRNTPLKAALLDQGIIAGLGNIYVCEALWRAGLSPRRLARTLSSKSGDALPKTVLLCDAVRAVIADAIEAGGSSLRDYVHTDGSLGYFQHNFAVYDREGEACRKPDCGGHVKRVVQSGRSSFYCPSCQR
ncbi:MAG: bifunctional DNA-formamidopyrimidine glycosylase/DNA-(apurinic or apyrimidinic site) lyase [Pseudomonadota bacterium]